MPLNNKILKVVIGVLILIIGYLLYERMKFPVLYSVCNAQYNDCTPVARFDDRDSCESANEKAGWYCDSTDPLNIKCSAKKSTISTGTCN